MSIELLLKTKKRPVAGPLQLRPTKSPHPLVAQVLRVKQCLRRRNRISTVVARCILPQGPTLDQVGDSRTKHLNRAARAPACSATVLQTTCSSEREPPWDLFRHPCPFRMPVCLPRARLVSDPVSAARTRRQDLRSSMSELWSSSLTRLRARSLLALQQVRSLPSEAALSLAPRARLFSSDRKSPVPLPNGHLLTISLTLSNG